MGLQGVYFTKKWAYKVTILLGMDLQGDCFVRKWAYKVHDYFTRKRAYTTVHVCARGLFCSEVALHGHCFARKWAYKVTILLGNGPTR
jgi:hypothetical protein